MEKQELKLKLDETIKEEGIDSNLLPLDIRRKIQLIRAAVIRCENSPTEALQTSILKQDVDVCNMIYDWLDAEEEVKKQEEEAKKKEEEEAKKKESKKYSFGTLDMSTAIQEKLKESGKISTTELKSIINKEPEYPEQYVLDIKLRKIYMQPFYKLN